MPELPEVETVRLGLAPVLVGNSFASVEQRRGDLRFPLPKHFAERLRGRKVDALDRRAKYLLARLDDGEVLVMHLGMTGRFSIDQANGKSLELGDFEYGQKPTPKHEHIVFHLADGTAVRYSDTRRFGLMDLIPGATLPSHALFKGLGNEPLGADFTPEWLASRLKGKATSIKAALVDQRLIAQQIEQALCLLQILRIGTLGEPGVDRRQKLERFLAPALIGPKRGEIPGGSKLEGLGLLASCRAQCLIEE